MSELKENVLNWIATGRGCSSSQAMALAACGIPTRGDYPSDPAVLNRCLLLLEAVPEVRAHFDKIAALGAVWAKLIDRWAEVEASFIDEVGLDWSKQGRAEKTWALMKEVIMEPSVTRIGAFSVRAL